MEEVAATWRDSWFGVGAPPGVDMASKL